ncbi:MAG: polysaccharide biosynthesis protein, partial [Planctomycetes bacterium]|nr:polysaccharide biosynthesis protein [Planctomycetota bacterium]
PLLLLPGALMVPVLPVIAAMFVNDRKRFRTQVVCSAALLLGLGGLGAVAGYLTSSELLALLYDGRYVDGALSAMPAFGWLCGAFFCVFAAAPLGTAMLAAGRERTLLKIALAGLVLNVVGNLALLPSMGFEAAALTTAATEGLVLLCMFVTVLQLVGHRLWVWALSRALLPAGVLAIVLGLLPAGGDLRMILAAVGGCIGAAIIFLGPTGRAFRRAVDGV